MPSRALRKEKMTALNVSMRASAFTSDRVAMQNLRLASEARAWSHLVSEAGPCALSFTSFANGAAQLEALAASLASMT